MSLKNITHAAQPASVATLSASSALHSQQCSNVESVRNVRAVKLTHFALHSHSSSRLERKLLAEMPRDAAKRDLTIVFKDWRSARAHSVGGELFKQTDGRENASSAKQAKHISKINYICIYILHTYRLQGAQTRSGTETETETETV